VDDGVLNARCDVEGIEHLRTALAAGRGAILLSAHMGNGPMIAVRLARAGFPVSIVYRQARMMSAAIYERGLPYYGIEGILANAGIRAYSRMLDALRRGRIVFVMMDQGTKAAKDGIVMRFLGKDMPMPAGPVQLSRHSGAPIVPLWNVAAEPVWKFTIGAPVCREPGWTLETEVEHLVRLTEQHILKYPHLWSWHHRRWRNFPMASMPR
jgi:KDO2-lipid IV(A) lauroyltransferase